MYSKTISAVFALLIVHLNVCADSTVADCVDAVSGEYFDYSADLQSDSLEIQRFYSTQQGNWLFLPEDYLALRQESMRHARVVASQGDMCEIILENSTHRFYEKAEEENLTLSGNAMGAASRFRLVQETLPDHSQRSYTYQDGFLRLIEQKNSWITFDYDDNLRESPVVKLSASNGKVVEYHFSPFTLADGADVYVLTHVEGTDVKPCTFEYEEHDGACRLVQKSDDCGHVLNITYNELGQVATIFDRSSEQSYTFLYGEGFTDVFDEDGTLLKRIDHAKKEVGNLKSSRLYW